MFPKGVIYQAGRSKDHGEIVLVPPTLTKIGYGLARGIGAGLIGFVVISLLFTFGPAVKQELVYDTKKITTTPAPYSDIDFAAAKKVDEVQKEAASFGVSSYFSVVIPKIDAKANVIPNVDAVDPGAYMQALSQGVAHAKGTYFPGQGKSIYLFSHSTDSPLNFSRYNAVFYLLGKLDPGDRVIVFFADQRYEYQVTEKKIVAANDTSWLSPESTEERLILQTCDPPGTTWNRLLVIAKPVS